MENKIKALKEAKRVLNKNGIIFIAYCMNDYSVINYLFKENIGYLPSEINLYLLYNLLL